MDIISSILAGTIALLSAAMAVLSETEKNSMFCQVELIFAGLIHRQYLLFLIAIFLFI